MRTAHIALGAWMATAALGCQGLVRAEKAPLPARNAGAAARARAGDAPLGSCAASAASRGPALPLGAAGAVALGAGGGTLVVADADTDRIMLVSIADRRVVRSVPTAAGPVAVALARDGRIFVVERRAGTVALFEPARHATAVCRVRVAIDPVALALSPDGRTLFVTSGITQTLTALDAGTLAPIFRTGVSREPRGIVVAPGGERVFVSHVAGDVLDVVDVRARRARPLPPLRTTITTHPHSTQLDAQLFQLIGRRSYGRVSLARAPWLDRDGRTLRVAVALSQTGSLNHVIMARAGRDVFLPQQTRSVGYGGAEEWDAGEKTLLAIASLDVATERWLPFAVPWARAGAAVRDPTAVSLRPSDGAAVIAGAGATRAAVIEPTVLARSARPMGVVNLGPMQTVPAPEGATGVAVTSDGSIATYSPVERAIWIVHPAGRRDVVGLGPAPLSPEVARGRRLFFRSNDQRISFAGLSCNGCHPDGRDDGLVWFIRRGPRQTPTLAGRLFSPFTWNGSRATLRSSIRSTVRRLGGTGLGASDVAALEAFLRQGLWAPERPTVEPSAQQLRGRELFEENDCVSCHDPSRHFVDGRAHRFGSAGMHGPDEFDTPALRWVAATPPYFHDGRHATLLDLLRDPTHGMTDLRGATPDEILALEDYLHTL